MKRLPVFPLTILLFLIALTSFSAPTDGVRVVGANQSGTLTGIQGLYVIVERLDRQVEHDGLTMDDVRETVEDKLRAGGLTVVSKATRTSTTPILNIQVGTAYDKERLEYAYTANLSVQENVFLQRNPKVEIVAATTWQQATVGKVGARSVETLIAEIDDLVDSFLLDYNKGKPKPGKASGK